MLSRSPPSWPRRRRSRRRPCTPWQPTARRWLRCSRTWPCGSARFRLSFSSSSTWMKRASARPRRPPSTWGGGCCSPSSASSRRSSCRSATWSSAFKRSPDWVSWGRRSLFRSCLSRSSTCSPRASSTSARACASSLWSCRFPDRPVCIRSRCCPPSSGSCIRCSPSPMALMRCVKSSGDSTGTRSCRAWQFSAPRLWLPLRLASRCARSWST